MEIATTFGPTHVKRLTPGVFYPPQQLAMAVAAQLCQARERGETIDFLAFVPDGEPALGRRE